MWCHILLSAPLIGLTLFLILPWPVALPLYLVVVAVSLFFYYKIMQSIHLPVSVGVEALLGRIVTVDSSSAVKIDGERWFIDTADVLPGQQVRIKAVNGLFLEVEPVDKTAVQSSNPIFFYGR